MRQPRKPPRKRTRDDSQPLGNDAPRETPPWHNDSVVSKMVSDARAENLRAGALALEKFEIVLHHAGRLHAVKVDMAKDTNYFLAFAHAIGVRGKGDAYLLVKLHIHRDVAIAWAQVEVAKHGSASNWLDWRKFTGELLGKVSTENDGDGDGAEAEGGGRGDGDGEAGHSGASHEIDTLQSQINELRSALDLAKQTVREERMRAEEAQDELKHAHGELETLRQRASVVNLDRFRAAVPQILEHAWAATFDMLYRATATFMAALRPADPIQEPEPPPAPNFPLEVLRDPTDAEDEAVAEPDPAATIATGPKSSPNDNERPGRRGYKVAPQLDRNNLPRDYFIDADGDIAVPNPPPGYKFHFGADGHIDGAVEDKPGRGRRRVHNLDSPVPLD